MLIRLWLSMACGSFLRKYSEQIGDPVSLRFSGVIVGFYRLLDQKDCNGYKENLGKSEFC
ncbi:LOW QUALITY PROTEIN: hypothetical protein TorRG33x02_340800 [Trema orientale]|uniref:Uncharacterized protein n=1 Tax=Trema orientale TaxID=63057 RepID=A0A2P5AUM2_TREOI|nr:LOW QUALITY PROTEIN: hypothetical protein TorRG33x02_340800 [Trema orientale]